MYKFTRKVMKICHLRQCYSIKAPIPAQKSVPTFCKFKLLSYLCTRFRCFSSVVERILGKDEVPSSTLGSSS